VARAAIIGKRIRQRRKSRCIVIAGPNGAGKTTFALRWLPGQRIDEFVNADLIAKGISPLDPSRAAIAAGRLLVEKLDQLAGQGTSFAFESTLSGLSYAKRLRQFKALGYRVEVIFLALPSSAVALQRVQSRVAQGGHDVPRADIVRRFKRGLENFRTVYCPLADSWALYDNSGPSPVFVESGP
jgi:predicted ABC-type ATPase